MAAAIVTADIVAVRGHGAVYFRGGVVGQDGVLDPPLPPVEMLRPIIGELPLIVQLRNVFPSISCPSAPTNMEKRWQDSLGRKTRKDLIN